MRDEKDNIWVGLLITTKGENGKMRVGNQYVE